MAQDLVPKSPHPMEPQIRQATFQRTLAARLRALQAAWAAADRFAPDGQLHGLCHGLGEAAGACGYPALALAARKLAADLACLAGADPAAADQARLQGDWDGLMVLANAAAEEAPVAAAPWDLQEQLDRAQAVIDRRRRWARRRQLWRWLALISVLGFLAALPFLFWWHQPPTRLEVLILDKTVADHSCREHRGLVWILDHDKYRQRDGSPYRYDRDYFGFFPLPGDQFRIRPVSDHPGPVDVVYIADTYGVYEEEFYRQNLGNRSQKIYGGLEPEELRHLRRILAPGGTLVAEFNAFASPTDGAARAELCDWLGIHWDSWIARFFPDLVEGGEVPPWAVRNYERQYRRKWNFEGRGYVFTNEFDQIVVLAEGEDTRHAACQMIFDPAGTRQLNQSGSYRYNYWFDILHLQPGTIPLAHYELNLTEEGRRKLSEHHIPTQFPAVAYRQDGGQQLYYFAGDFADMAYTPWLYQAKGLVPFHQWSSLEGDDQNARFFWKGYVPMVRMILDQARAQVAAARANP